MYHTPVLLKESIEGLNIKGNGTYVDATYGGGGHTNEMLKNVGNEGTIMAFDQDPEALENKIDDERVVMINQNFRYMKNFLKLFRLVPVDGILADLGVSSHQLDDPRRGFSTRFDGPLDFRMNPAKPLKALQVVNDYSVLRLTEIFRSYGEIQNAMAVAKRIDSARSINPLNTTAELREAILPLAKRGQESKFLAQVFQAIRIEVNDELGALSQLLMQAAGLLKEGGRLVVITYHSLEDRLVKNFIRTGNTGGELKKDFYGNPIRPFVPVNNKPIVPSEEEIEKNRRARSAKLRIAEKIRQNNE